MPIFSSRGKLLSLSLLFALAGCGKFDRLDDGGFTRVTFNRAEHSPTSALMNGGLIIYANSAGYSTNMKLSAEDQPATLTLPNGVYTFYAFGYGAANGFTSISGDVKCALAADVPLTGASQTVTLALTPANCLSTGFFSPSNHVLATGTQKYFRYFDVVACGSSVDVSTKTAGVDCSSGSTWSAASGYQVVLPTYRASDDASFVKMGEAYRSACATGSTGLSPGYSVPSGFYIPWGIPGSTQRFPTEIEVFADTSCTTKLTSYMFPRGLSSSPKTGVGFPALTTSTLSLFLRQP